MALVEPIGASHIPDLERVDSTVLERQLNGGCEKIGGIVEGVVIRSGRSRGVARPCKVACLRESTGAARSEQLWSPLACGSRGCSSRGCSSRGCSSRGCSRTRASDAELWPIAGRGGCGRITIGIGRSPRAAKGGARRLAGSRGSLRCGYLARRDRRCDGSSNRSTGYVIGWRRSWRSGFFTSATGPGCHHANRYQQTANVPLHGLPRWLHSGWNRSRPPCTLLRNNLQ
jgi:hypothetical protein